MKPEDLLAAVYANPADDAPRAVYADALVEQGNPLGELIQLQLGTRKGSKKRAKELFDPTFWKDHPTGLIYERVQEWTVHRGFPFQFNCPSPTDYPRWKAHAKHPGWSTIEIFWGHYELAADEAAAVIFASARMPLLEEVTWAHPATLGVLAKTDHPIRRLHAAGNGETLPSLARLTRLELLEWGGVNGQGNSDVSEDLAAVEELQVLDRIRELRLMWSTTETPVADALATIGNLPRNVERLRIGNETYVDATRDGGLEIMVSSEQVEPMAEELAALKTNRISSLRVTFLMRGGFFTKKNHPGLAARMKEATKHFKKRELDLGKKDPPAR